MGALWLGCDRPEVNEGSAAAALGEDVVARVGAWTIGRDEALATAHELGCSPGEAVAARVDLELLAREAEARGLGSRDEVRDAVDRRLVQALLELRVEPAARQPLDERLVAEGIQALTVRAQGAPVDDAVVRAAVERRLRLEMQHAALEELLRSLEPSVERPQEDVRQLLAAIQPAGPP